MANIPAIEKERKRRAIAKELVTVFERLLAEYGDTPETRLMITRCTMGYMGASYGLTIAGEV